MAVVRTNREPASRRQIISLRASGINRGKVEQRIWTFGIPVGSNICRERHPPFHPLKKVKLHRRSRTFSPNFEPNFFPNLGSRYTDFTTTFSSRNLKYLSTNFRPSTIKRFDDETSRRYGKKENRRICIFSIDSTLIQN